MRNGLGLLGYGSYAAYLGSGLWASTRRRLIRRRCEACGSRAGLVLHHMTYRTLGVETEQDVCTLCGRCHRLAHGRARETGSLYVPEVVQARLGRPLRTRAIGALEVDCPRCGARSGMSCTDSSGDVRGEEHKERRRLDDLRRREQGQRRVKTGKRSLPTVAELQERTKRRPTSSLQDRIDLGR